MNVSVDTILETQLRHTINYFRMLSQQRVNEDCLCLPLTAKRNRTMKHNDLITKREKATTKYMK